MANWTDGLVLGTSAASAGDDELRSFMTQFASGISASYYWPGSGGGSLASAGVSQLGNLRTAHSGNVSGGFSNGFLSLHTGHVSLHHIGTTPHLVGHSSMVDHDPDVVVPGSSRWVTQRGSFSISSSGGDGRFGRKSVSFISAYQSTPYIQLSVQQATAISATYFVVLASSSTTGFSSFYSGTASSDAVTVNWESCGSLAI